MTTAYKEFALEGYEYNVTDYLVKPTRFWTVPKNSTESFG